MSKFRVHSYVNKKITYDFYTQDLENIFNDTEYSKWFDKNIAVGNKINTEIYLKGTRLLKHSTDNSKSLCSSIDVKVLGKPQPVKEKQVRNNTERKVITSSKLWTTQEDDIIRTYNPELTHAKDVIEELGSMLPDRTLGAINERVKIFRAMNEYNEIEELYTYTEEWTTYEEDYLHNLVETEAHPLSYKLTARLKVDLPNKGYHTIRTKIRELLKLK